MKSKNIDTKKLVCWPSPGCHNRCGLLADVRDGRIENIRGNLKYPGPGHGCPDRLPHFTKWLNHPDQLMYPLKRTGDRGENRWQRISWSQALDEIADKLKDIKSEYGAESLVVNEGTFRTDLLVIRCRFLNLFGNPQNVGCPGTVCMLNRMALRIAMTGANITVPRLSTAKCIIFSGWDAVNSRYVIWKEVKRRLKEDKNVRLIVIDPRRTKAADMAHLWLQIRPGTDAALFMAWINVIIEENLYDRDFVDKWTFGFERLRQRASEYTPEKVEEITWVPAALIRKSARVYAMNKPAFFGRGVSSDQIGLNGTRVEHARNCLRAITGNMARGGGEPVLGPGPIIDGKMGIRDSQLQLEEKCPPEQRKKQLGSERFKLMTWPAYEITNKLYKEKYGIPLSLSGHNFLSPAPLVWRAILSGEPYSIKAMITWTANPLVSAANTKLVYKALKSDNLALHVVLEHFMTPTALFADYVLPVASKFEKPIFSTSEDGSASFLCGERAVEPMGERRSDYDFYRELAIRLGFGEYFPWKTEEELADYRLEPLGITFREAATERYVVNSSEPWTYETINPRTGKPTGFATPSGKIELYSNILERLGYDPLPYYEEPPESPVRTPDVARDYPLILTTGGRFRPQFHSEQRQFGMGMREQHPDPLMDIHPETAKKLGISEGDWVYVETRRGVIKQRAHVTDGIHPKVVNAESQWWFPEQPAEEPWLHGLWQSNANVLTMDDPETCDPLTGGWAYRALLCKVYKAQNP